MFRGSTFDFPFNTLEAVHEQVFKVPSIAVGRKDVEVVYVEIPALVRMPNLRGVCMRFNQYSDVMSDEM